MYLKEIMAPSAQGVGYVLSLMGPAHDQMSKTVQQSDLSKTDKHG